MNIRNYGDVVFCRDIVFEDDKYDVRQGHPGVVLLPTTEEDDQVYCLYMTSDGKRGKREEFIKYTGKAVKNSYVNLQHIIKIENNKKEEMGILDDKKFLELLEELYSFQKNLENPNKDFLDIKSKIEVLKELLKLNLECGIKEPISAEMIKHLDDINPSKRKLIYSVKMSLTNNNNKEIVKNKILKNEKERIYNEKLIEVYNKLRDKKLDKIDLNNLNNEIRILYMEFKSKNYLINTDSIFSDLALLFKDNKREKLQEFVKLERERLQLKQKAEKEKREEKKSKVAARKKNIAKYNEKNKKRREISKYGKSEFFK